MMDWGSHAALRIWAKDGLSLARGDFELHTHYVHLHELILLRLFLALSILASSKIDPECDWRFLYLTS